MACYRFDIISKAMSTAPTLSGASATHAALLSDRLFVVHGTAVKAAGDGAVLAATWRSRPFIHPWPEGYGWIRVNGPEVASVTVRYRLAGAVVHTATFTSRSPQRLPALKDHRIELEIEAAERVTSVSVAKTPQELAP